MFRQVMKIYFHALLNCPFLIFLIQVNDPGVYCSVHTVHYTFNFFFCNFIYQQYFRVIPKKVNNKKWKDFELLAI